MEKKDGEVVEDQKTQKAVEAVIELGFSELVVRTVLRDLLTAYEGDWTHIEADNFVVLIQALLEHNPLEEVRSPSIGKAKTLDAYFDISSSPASKTPVRQLESGKAKAELSSTESEREKKQASRKRDESSSKQPSSSKRARQTEPGNTSRDGGGGDGQRWMLAAQTEPGISQKFKMYEKHDPRDISKGAERFPVPLIGPPHEMIPANFLYVSKSIVYDKAVVNVSLSSIGDRDCCTRCFQNCLKKKFPCACTQETDGEFPYTEDGCLRTKFLERAMKEARGESVHRESCKGPCQMGNFQEDPTCKGHIVRKFLKECWSKCSCHRTKCGNRLVQLGVKYKLEVFWSSDVKGWGLRSSEDLPQGAFVCEFAGEILTNTELYERNNRKTEGRHTYPVQLNADVCAERIFGDDDLLCLDATEYGNVARFINHRCEDANLIDVPVQIEMPHRHYYHVAFFTKWPVKAFEELTWDYSIDFDDEEHPIKAFKCHCGSSLCRQKKNKKKKN